MNNFIKKNLLIALIFSAPGNFVWTMNPYPAELSQQDIELYEPNYQTNRFYYGQYPLEEYITDAKYLRSKGINIEDINEINQNGIPWLIDLSQNLHSDSYNIIKVMIKAGANVNITTETNDYTPLWFAAIRNDIIIANLLLEHAANPNAPNNQGTTILFYELTETMSELLINAGADINWQDNTGSTVLHEAATESNEDKVAWLLAHDDLIPTLVNKRSQTAADVAAGPKAPHIRTMIQQAINRYREEKAQRIATVMQRPELNNQDIGEYIGSFL